MSTLEKLLTTLASPLLLAAAPKKGAKKAPKKAAKKAPKKAAKKAPKKAPRKSMTRKASTPAAPAEPEVAAHEVTQ